jgi:hypothetical protein
MLKLWLVPAAAVLFWIVLAASSVAELGTLQPSLRAAAGVVHSPRVPRARVKGIR